MKKTSARNLGKLFSFCFLLLTSLSSCKIMYSPTMQNVPLLQEKGDLKFVTNTNNLQAAYAITDHVGAVANGSFHNNTWQLEGDNSEPDQTYRSLRFNAEGGLGYFKTLGEKSVFETFAGAGYGQVRISNKQFDNFYNQEQQLRFDTDAFKVFVQPAIGFKDKNLEMAFSTRVVALKFNEVATNYSVEQLMADQLYNLNGPTHLFLEPAYTLRVGFEWVKLQGQIMYSAKLNKDPINYKPLNINLSLQFSLPREQRKGLFN